MRRAYVAPYDSWANRIATLRFVQDIPLVPNDPAWKIVAETAERLDTLRGKAMWIGWGLRDFTVGRKHIALGSAAAEEALPRIEATLPWLRR